MTILLNHILNKYTSIKSLTLSIDDFYLSILERNELAKNIHPMCKTRGVPGTHNIDKLIQTISLLTNNNSNKDVLLPAFSKVDDDYSPIDEWRTYKGRPDIILLEGWCIGAVPIKKKNWLPPLNSLEKRLDPEGEWAKWSNSELGKRYQDLFSLIDLLIMIRLPSMEHVYESRWIQEKTLEKINKGEKVSSKVKIYEFVMHFERLTRHMFKTLPSYADLIIERDLDFNYVIK
jgi:D-glycerate 3-kinase